MGKAHQCPIECMPDVPSGTYIAAFSIWVLEHVGNLSGAAREIARVLQPGGLFVATIPSPAAPEFVIARHTSTRFHTWFRRALTKVKQAWETSYACQSIAHLTAVFGHSGFEVVDVVCMSCIGRYPRRFRLLRLLAKCFDSVIDALKIRRLRRHVCLVLRKTH
ncbi:MAG: methyltransferase domain-containing protein [Verrucomicrobia bacterium]|nr:methyltransferase domain-containing protein [Verrucomicrobiota bacterium]